MLADDPQAEACGLRTFFQDVHELQSGLLDCRNVLEQLRNVVQGEQERTSAIERAAIHDRGVLEIVKDGFERLQVQVNSSLQASNMARVDASNVSTHLKDACNRLLVHDGELEMAPAQIADLQTAAALTISRRRFLANCNNAISCLEERSGNAEEQTRCLSEAHGSTARSLQHLVDDTVTPAIKKAAEDRAWIAALDSRTQVLEAHKSDAIEKTSQLHGASNAMLSSLTDLSSQHNDLFITTTPLQEELAETRTGVGVDHVRLDDAVRHIAEMQQGKRDQDVALRHTNDAIAEARKVDKAQAEQVASLADMLTALRQGLTGTDGGVCSLQALLEGVPAETV
jgi:chromosome segregation ATPase